MADVMRWRYGDTNPVLAAVNSATVIEIGDLVYQDTDDAKPASQQADGGSEAANQETFKDNFLGVAMQRSRSGDTASIRVATTGVFEFICASATFELGDLIGVSENGDGNALEDQTVKSVMGLGGEYAIGLCAKRVATASTSVLVDIRSSVMGQSIISSSTSLG